VLALEDDQITTAARRRISDRIAELEQEIADQQASLGKLRAVLDATPTDAPTVADLLDRLPIFGNRLREFSQSRLRGLFDSLDLMVNYDPIRHAARVRIRLVSDAGGLRGTGRCPRQEPTAQSAPRPLGYGGGQDLQVGADPHGRAGQPGP